MKNLSNVIYIAIETIQFSINCLIIYFFIALIYQLKKEE